MRSTSSKKTPRTRSLQPSSTDSIDTHPASELQTLPTDSTGAASQNQGAHIRQYALPAAPEVLGFVLVRTSRKSDLGPQVALDPQSDNSAEPVLCNTSRGSGSLWCKGCRPVSPFGGQEVAGSNPASPTVEALAPQGLLAIEFVTVADSCRDFWVISWSPQAHRPRVTASYQGDPVLGDYLGG